MTVCSKHRGGGYNNGQYAQESNVNGGQYVQEQNMEGIKMDSTVTPFTQKLWLLIFPLFAIKAPKNCLAHKGEGHEWSNAPHSALSTHSQT